MADNTTVQPESDGGFFEVQITKKVEATSTLVITALDESEAMQRADEACAEMRVAEGDFDSIQWLEDNCTFCEECTAERAAELAGDLLPVTLRLPPEMVGNLLDLLEQDIEDLRKHGDTDGGALAKNIAVYDLLIEQSPTIGSKADTQAKEASDG
jgi:hypothetical protein